MPDEAKAETHWVAYVANALQVGNQVAAYKMMAVAMALALGIAVALAMAKEL